MPAIPVKAEISYVNSASGVTPAAVLRSHADCFSIQKNLKVRIADCMD